MDNISLDHIIPLVQQTITIEGTGLDGEPEAEPGLIEVFFGYFFLEKQQWINLYGIPESYKYPWFTAYKYEVMYLMSLWYSQSRIPQLTAVM